MLKWTCNPSPWAHTWRYWKRNAGGVPVRLFLLSKDLADYASANGKLQIANCQLFHYLYYLINISFRNVTSHLSMIRTLIIDDEIKNRNRLNRMIRNHFPNISVIGEAESVQTGIEAIRKLKPELVLLDIKMPDGDGFDLLEKIDNIFFRIIFITAYEEYALKAIKYSALDYLVKPVIVEEMRMAFEKAEAQIFNDLKVQLSTLQGNLRSPKHRTLVLKTIDKIYLVEIMEIVRCESDGHYTRFFTREGKRYMVSNPMKEYEDILEEHGFFRIHKSHIVNLLFIESFAREGYVKLKDNTTLPVSRRKKNELIEKFTSL